MNSLVVSGLVLLVLLLLAIFWSRGKKGKALPYDLQETLFSPAERSFLGVLDLAVGDQAWVFAKVRVADVLTPETGMGKSKWQQAFNKISAKHVDYLLCHPSDLSFICAIELDDSPIATRSARCATVSSRRPLTAPVCRCCRSRQAAIIRSKSCANRSCRC